AAARIARPRRTGTRRGRLRPGSQRAPDRGDLRAARAEPGAHAGPVRSPPPAAGRRAALARVPDPLSRRPLRAARLLPARSGGGALRRGGSDRAHRADLALRPRLGALSRAALAPPRPRDPPPAAPSLAASPRPARARLRHRPPERVDAAAGRLARAPAREARRLAPADGARQRGARPALPVRHLGDREDGGPGDRDRRRRRAALPPAAADRRDPELGGAATRRSDAEP